MAKREFDQTGHPCEPHHVADNFWYYVQKDGLTACQYLKGHNTEVGVIPWRLVKLAMADHEKAKGRRRPVSSPQETASE